ncbi:MAG: helicase-related protein [Erysipelotrichaceae bacterium]
MPTCPRCLNTDIRYFVQIDGCSVCRRCISFNGEEGESRFSENEVEYNLSFNLTKKQTEVSKQCANLSFTQDVLIHAVCGAGKTELIYESIKAHLNVNHRVGITVARRQVVLQLHQRLSKVFNTLKVTKVCEGYTDDLEGQLIICTSHQLYRFKGMFDCLIVDEPDAYPLSNNPVLEGFVRQACIGYLIYLSATPDKPLLNRVKHKDMAYLTLNQRPHGKALIKPRLILSPLIFQWMMEYHYSRHISHPLLVFVPTIQMGKLLSKLLHIPFISSQTVNADQLIQQFSTHQITSLLCTTILERGVTFSDVNVIIIQANHFVFTHSTLIQIAGRVGRDMNHPEGSVLFLCQRISNAIKTCQKDISLANHSV